VIAQISAGYSLIHLVILAIIVCAVVGIALVAIRASGVSIPDWAVRIFWIVVVAVIAILAIRFLVGIAW
jgi:hypothetical protein